MYAFRTRHPVLFFVRLFLRDILGFGAVVKRRGGFSCSAERFCAGRGVSSRV